MAAARAGRILYPGRFCARLNKRMIIPCIWGSIDRNGIWVLQPVMWMLWSEKRKKDYRELRMHIWKIIYYQERFDFILETIILLDF